MLLRIYMINPAIIWLHKDTDKKYWKRSVMKAKTTFYKAFIQMLLSAIVNRSKLRGTTPHFLATHLLLDFHSHTFIQGIWFYQNYLQ